MTDYTHYKLKRLLRPGFATMVLVTIAGCSFLGFPKADRFTKTHQYDADIYSLAGKNTLIDNKDFERRFLSCTPYDSKKMESLSKALIEKSTGSLLLNHASDNNKIVNKANEILQAIQDMTKNDCHYPEVYLLSALLFERLIEIPDQLVNHDESSGKEERLADESNGSADSLSRFAKLNSGIRAATLALKISDYDQKNQLFMNGYVRIGKFDTTRNVFVGLFEHPDSLTGKPEQFVKDAAQKATLYKNLDSYARRILMNLYFERAMYRWQGIISPEQLDETVLIPNENQGSSAGGENGRVQDVIATDFDKAMYYAQELRGSLQNDAQGAQPSQLIGANSDAIAIAQKSQFLEKQLNERILDADGMSYTVLSPMVTNFEVAVARNDAIIDQLSAVVAKLNKNRDNLLKINDQSDKIAEYSFQRDQQLNQVRIAAQAAEVSVKQKQIAEINQTAAQSLLRAAEFDIAAATQEQATELQAYANLLVREANLRAIKAQMESIAATDKDNLTKYHEFLFGKSGSVTAPTVGSWAANTTSLGEMDIKLSEQNIVNECRNLANLYYQNSTILADTNCKAPLPVHWSTTCASSERQVIEESCDVLSSESSVADCQDVRISKDQYQYVCKTKQTATRHRKTVRGTLSGPKLNGLSATWDRGATYAWGSPFTEGTLQNFIQNVLEVQFKENIDPQPVNCEMKLVADTSSGVGSETSDELQNPETYLNSYRAELARRPICNYSTASSYFDNLFTGRGNSACKVDAAIEASLQIAKKQLADINSEIEIARKQKDNSILHSAGDNKQVSERKLSAISSIANDQQQLNLIANAKIESIANMLIQNEGNEALKTEKVKKLNFSIDEISASLQIPGDFYENNLTQSQWKDKIENLCQGNLVHLKNYLSNPASDEVGKELAKSFSMAGVLRAQMSSNDSAAQKQARWFEIQNQESAQQQMATKLSELAKELEVISFQKISVIAKLGMNQDLQHKLSALETSFSKSLGGQGFNKDAQNSLNKAIMALNAQFESAHLKAQQSRKEVAAAQIQSGIVQTEIAEINSQMKEIERAQASSYLNEVNLKISSIQDKSKNYLYGLIPVNDAFLLDDKVQLSIARQTAKQNIRAITSFIINRGVFENTITSEYNNILKVCRYLSSYQDAFDCLDRINKFTSKTLIGVVIATGSQDSETTLNFSIINRTMADENGNIAFTVFDKDNIASIQEELFDQNILDGLNRQGFASIDLSLTTLCKTKKAAFLKLCGERFESPEKYRKLLATRVKSIAVNYKTNDKYGVKKSSSLVGNRRLKVDTTYLIRDAMTKNSSGLDCDMVKQLVDGQIAYAQTKGFASSSPISAASLFNLYCLPLTWKNDFSPEELGTFAVKEIYPDNYASTRWVNSWRFPGISMSDGHGSENGYWLTAPTAVNLDEYEFAEFLDKKGKCFKFPTATSDGDCKDVNIVRGMPLLGSWTLAVPMEVRTNTIREVNVSIVIQEF